jgi:AcrR family transcriptional regulator
MKAKRGKIIQKVSRIDQKELTRRRLIDVALQLSSEKGFSALSLREVASGAGITAAGFYRHFDNMEELGITLMDEVGLSLRQLLRQTRRERPAMPQSKAIALSVKTFLDYIRKNQYQFRLLLGERTGTSEKFRKALRMELDLFISELAIDLERSQREYSQSLREPRLTAEAIVAVVFTVGSEALDLKKAKIDDLTYRLTEEIQIIIRGSLKI